MHKRPLIGRCGTMTCTHAVRFIVVRVISISFNKNSSWPRWIREIIIAYISLNRMITNCVNRCRVTFQNSPAKSTRIKPNEQMLRPTKKNNYFCSWLFSLQELQIEIILFNSAPSVIKAISMFSRMRSFLMPFCRIGTQWQGWMTEWKPMEIIHELEVQRIPRKTLKMNKCDS